MCVYSDQLHNSLSTFEHFNYSTPFFDRSEQLWLISYFSTAQIGLFSQTYRNLRRGFPARDTPWRLQWTRLDNSLHKYLSLARLTIRMYRSKRLRPRFAVPIPTTAEQTIDAFADGQNSKEQSYVISLGYAPRYISSVIR